MRRFTAKTIGEVLNVVREARALWKLDPEEEMWFRGEDAKYRSSTLQPKLYRHLAEELRFVSKAILKEEHRLKQEFEHCGAQLYEHDVDDWDWYFLMQHHGAPTRLLDWSDGALMGTHFAVSGDIDSTEGGFVYVLDPHRLVDKIDDLEEVASHKKAWASYRKYMLKRRKRWPLEWDQVYLPNMHNLSRLSRSNKASTTKTVRRPELPEPPLLLEFPHITRRVAAQRSRFMVFGKDKNWFARWAARSDSRIWCIHIPKSRVKAIKVQLRDAGITESVIFPDLDGLGRELNQFWNSVKGGAAFRK